MYDATTNSIAAASSCVLLGVFMRHESHAGERCCKAHRERLLITDVTPGVSNVKDGYIALTGTNPVNGEKVSGVERVASGVFATPLGGNAVKLIVKGGGSLGAAIIKGVARHGDEAAEVVEQVARSADDVVEAQVVQNGRRGRQSEGRVLDDMGMEKNTDTVETAEGTSIPDGLDDATSVEVKDTQKVSATRQVRIQTDAASRDGRTSVLVTGTRTKVSKPAKDRFDVIIRRDDLGPQQNQMTTDRRLPGMPSLPGEIPEWRREKIYKADK